MKIFSKTLKQEFPLTALFCIILPVTLFLVIQEFSIARHIDFRGYITEVPESLKRTAEALLVINVFGGYLHLVASVNWIIVAGFYVCISSSGMIAGEMEKKTMGLLLAHPVSRLRVILEKYLANVVNVIIVTAFAFLGFYMGTYHGFIEVPYKVSKFALVCVNGLAFFIALSAISFIFSVIFDEHKKAATASLLFFVLSYLAFFLGAFSERWMKVKKFILFRFFDTETLFLTGGFHWSSVGWLVVIAVIAFVIAAVIFQKKEIN